MKKLATYVIAVAGLIGTPALAADMAIKAPPPPPAPVYSWTGWYVGGNVGYSWGNARTGLTGSGTAIGFEDFTNSFGFGSSNRARLDGVIGGGQVGYNYQFNPKWVLGFEADIQGSGQRGSGSFIDPFSTPVCFDAGDIALGCTGHGSVQGTSATGYQAKIAWFGTVRARLGVLITDEVLLYGTGGLAYGQVKVSGNTILSGSVSCGDTCFPVDSVPFAPVGTAFSASKTNVGFSAGGGVEGKISGWLPGNWTWKLEYLYTDLGSFNSVSPFTIAVPPSFSGEATTLGTGAIFTRTHFTDNIVRIGLNYQFH